MVERAPVLPAGCPMMGRLQQLPPHQFHLPVDRASNNAYGRAEGNQMLSKQNPFDIHLIKRI